MRSKTSILGLLSLVLMAVVFISSRPNSTEADYGFNPGEQLPSIEVKGVRWLSDLHDDSLSYVVVWSKGDAVSRAVSSWVSRSANNPNVGVYSICLDANQTDTDLISLLDDVTPGTRVLGLRSGDVNKKDLKVLRENADGYLFVVRRGSIKKALKTTEAWPQISSGADLLKERAVFGIHDLL